LEEVSGGTGNTYPTRLKFCGCLRFGMCRVITQIHLNGLVLNHFHISYADIARLVCALANVMAAILALLGGIFAVVWSRYAHRGDISERAADRRTANVA
jgi:hypothetical protein